MDVVPVNKTDSLANYLSNPEKTTDLSSHGTALVSFQSGVPLAEELPPSSHRPARLPWEVTLGGTYHLAPVCSVQRARARAQRELQAAGVVPRARDSSRVYIRSIVCRFNLGTVGVTLQ